MTKKKDVTGGKGKVDANLKLKGTLTIENDARGKQYKREVEVVEQAEIAEFEALEKVKKELIATVKDEVQIYQKAMKGKHIAELFSDEEE